MTKRITINTTPREFYVHVTDGRGCFAGMRNVIATRREEAIITARSAWKDIPACSTQWFASDERKWVKSGRR